MKSYVIADKEYEFKRPTPVVLAVVESIVQESELFNAIVELPKMWSEDKGKFAKLAGDWERFCNAAFKNGFVPELALENIIYPDEVRGAADDFFASSWERTMKRLNELRDTLATRSTSS